LFIGAVQAFIFAFLTIIYFAQSMEDRSKGAH
jgi:F0F1-type ATP synthase membrane subunit a